MLRPDVRIVGVQAAGAAAYPPSRRSSPRHRSDAERARRRVSEGRAEKQRSARLPDVERALERRAAHLARLLHRPAARRVRQEALELRLDVLPCEQSLFLHGDEERVQQIVLNLLSNSVKFTPPGGVVKVTACPRDEVIDVQVQDTGVGIPREVQSKIFEPFYTTKPPGRGTGLGLSICYGIVEDHRGRIEVDSQPGRGTTFRVFLPVYQ